MANAYIPLSYVLILYDPDDLHNTLDEDNYFFFRRVRTFDDVRDLLEAEQYGHIDLHVPTTFTFDDMRERPEVYIHTYFIDNEDTTLTNDTERQKIRDSIRLWCMNLGEDFVERGVMNSNEYIYDQGLSLAEQLLQMDELTLV